MVEELQKVRESSLIISQNFAGIRKNIFWSLQALKREQERDREIELKYFQQPLYCWILSSFTLSLCITSNLTLIKMYFPRWCFHTLRKETKSLTKNEKAIEVVINCIIIVGITMEKIRCLMQHMQTHKNKNLIIFHPSESPPTTHTQKNLTC